MGKEVDETAVVFHGETGIQALITPSAPLPRLPSALIRVGVRDLEACERDGRYEVHMYDWHRNRRGKCSVCLAGAVMAQTLGRSPSDDLEPYFFETDTALALDALNSLRMGIASTALIDLGLVTVGDAPSIIHLNRTIPRYQLDPPAFKKAMLDYADFLEQEGY